MESFNFSKSNKEKYFWLHSLILSKPVSDILLQDRENLDAENLQVEIKINQVTLNTEQFNDFMNACLKRVQEHVEQKLEYTKSEKAVNDAAQSLLKEKLGNIYEVLNSIEHETSGLDLSQLRNYK
jgi:hypothetical protein